MQPDFWDDKRPAGVANQLDFASYRSVVEVFERSCKKFADRPAFSNLGVTLSYAELERHSAAFAAWVAVGRLLDPRPVTNVPAVAVAALVGFAGNEWVARYRIRTGRRIGSAALVADGLHARTDGFTSLAVLLGAGNAAGGYVVTERMLEMFKPSQKTEPKA